MSSTKRNLENLIIKAQEEFCEWLLDLLTYTDMKNWSQANWSDTAKHFSFCFILKNTGNLCKWDRGTLSLFRDHLLDAASDSGYIDF